MWDCGRRVDGKPTTSSGDADGWRMGGGSIERCGNCVRPWDGDRTEWRCPRDPRVETSIWESKGRDIWSHSGA